VDPDHKPVPVGVPLAPAPTGLTPPGADAARIGAEAPAPAGAAPPDRGPRSGRWVLEWSVVIVAAVLLAFGVRTYVAQMFYIPSGSMLPTLQVGDRIVVDKLAYRVGSVHRGDIVVFARPPLVDADYTDLVKRVIGLPGETIGLLDGHVTIDGKILGEPWLPHPEPQSEPSSLPDGFSLTHPYTIPANHYFVMGDNRPDSEDSRYFGPIPGSLIVGKMVVRVWPIDRTVWLGALAVLAVVLFVGVWTVLRRSGAGPPEDTPDRGAPS
jgi:signal peptidase I